MSYRFILVLGAFLILSGSATADYVGVAPGVKDLGTVERGETYEVEFYLVTNIDQEFRVKPSYERPNPQIYRKEQQRRYRFLPRESSQEKIEDWVKFTRDTYNVDPSTDRAVSLSNGGTANAKGSIDFFLQVPEDAEPGYHAGAVNINPLLGGSDGGRGAAVTTLGLSQFIFVFRVPGAAERSLEIKDVNALRKSDGSVRLDYLVKNTGTTTVRINRGNTFLYDSFGNRTGTLTYGGNYIEPGETEVVKNFWQKPKIESGEYRIRGEMNYITGNSIIDTFVNVSEYVQIEQTGDDQEQNRIQLWIVLMVLVLLGAVMYVLEIDPLLVVMAVGTIAISGYIIIAGLPVYLIGILILVIFALIFYGWFL